jgi:hypothetical protein
MRQPTGYFGRQAGCTGCESLGRTRRGLLPLGDDFQALCDVPLISRSCTLGALCLGRLHDNPFAWDQLKDKLAQEKLLEDEIRS